jgi:Uma2 family endonuclease
MTTLELPTDVEWSPEVLERLPADFRYAVSEGNLVIMAAAMRPWHAEVQRRVVNLLVNQGRPAYIEQGVVLGSNEIRTCDVGVYRRSPTGSQAYRPADEFALLVEVVSKDSRREDREIKPRLYAQAGVPEYWRIEESDTGEAVVYVHSLVRPEGRPATYPPPVTTTLEALESGENG